MVKARISLRYFICKGILFAYLYVIAMLKISLLLAAEDISMSNAKNVTYEEVIELPFRGSDYTISYGDELSQFGRLWLPREKRAPLYSWWLLDERIWHRTLSVFDRTVQLDTQFGR